MLTLAGTLIGCSALRREIATRTPVPTYTPTPFTNQVAAVQAPQVAPVAEQATPTLEPPTPVPPTASPTFTLTPEPTATATDTPMPTNTPTATHTPLPTATPDYAFELETAEKFPTQSLAVNVVRVYAYIYSSRDYGLGDYSLQIHHNGARLPSEELSTEGLPDQTRTDPSAYTRFTNLNMIFVEAQAGTWTIDLLGPEGNIVGPQAQFQLTDNESTRELYVRYRRK